MKSFIESFQRFTLDYHTIVVRLASRKWGIFRLNYYPEKHWVVSEKSYSNPAAAKRAFEAELVTYKKLILSGTLPET